MAVPELAPDRDHVQVEAARPLALVEVMPARNLPFGAIHVPDPGKRIEKIADAADVAQPGHHVDRGLGRKARDSGAAHVFEALDSPGSHALDTRAFPEEAVRPRRVIVDDDDAARLLVIQ